jgi:hypothetical protein
MPPPSPDVISEAELRDTIRQIYRPPESLRGEHDPRQLIRVANCLIKSGRAKAVAAPPSHGFTFTVRLQGKEYVSPSYSLE